MINVLIVEDQNTIRSLLEMYVEQNKNYTVLASLSDASLAPQMCDSEKIDLVLMDVLTDNDESGLDATRIIKSNHPEIKVIVVTSLLDGEVLNKAREVGADSLWYKDVSESELMDIVKRTMRGESIFPDTPPVVSVGNSFNYKFTKKEIEVLRYIVKGMTYSQIAENMGVDVPAIKYHVSNMLQKTGFRDKLQLALAVQKSKIIVDKY